MHPTIKEIRNRVIEGDVISAAKIILPSAPKGMTMDVAGQIVSAFVPSLLNQCKYEQAASLLWGDDMFTTEPRSVGMLWKAINSETKLIVLGSGSIGKTYSVAFWTLLDWLRDPENTCSKIISLTGEHAKRNMFATIKNLHASSCIKLPGTCKGNAILIDGDDKQGIHLLAIKQGEDGAGRLRGFHPVPRKVPHPQFGAATRISVILDEAEEIPGGVWEDVDNILTGKDDKGTIKIVAMTNPKDPLSKLGVRAEPTDGYSSINIDEDEIWTSKHGWHVVRLDAAKTENIVYKKIIYPGMQTWEGFQNYVAQGTDSPMYICMARGMFPLKGTSTHVIPIDYVNRARGTYDWAGKTTFCMSVDLAFEGGDFAVATIGQFGLANGWIKPNGEKVAFIKPKMGTLVLAQHRLEKGDTIKIVDGIESLARQMRINGEFIIVDSTGAGSGTFHVLRNQFSREVMGLNWAEKATDMKLTEEDVKPAKELYAGVVSEMWYALRVFLEFDFIKFAPSLNTEDLFKELTDRKSRVKGKLLSVESKGEYKSRNAGKSPDWADSMIMLGHLVRHRSKMSVFMLDVNSTKKIKKKIKPGIVDVLQYEEML